MKRNTTKLNNLWCDFFLSFTMLIHYCHLFQIIVCTITLWQWEPPLRTAPPLTNITACVASPCTEAAALHRQGETLYWDTHPRRTIIGSVQPKKGRYLVKWLGLDSFYTTTSVKIICSFYWTKLFLKISNIFICCPPPLLRHIQLVWWMRQQLCWCGKY